MVWHQIWAYLFWTDWSGNRKSIDVKVVNERKFGKWLAVTNDRRTDHRHCRNIEIERHFDRKYNFSVQTNVWARFRVMFRFEAFREGSGQWSHRLRGQPVREHCYREHPGSLTKEAWEAYKTSLETGWLALFNKLSSQSQSFLLLRKITDFCWT